MTVSSNDMEYQDFLSLISGINTIKKYRLSLNYNDEIKGTLEQLNELAQETENTDFKRFVFELNQEANKEISDVEVKKYLKELTDNFNVDLTKTALRELIVFEDMIFHEELNEASEQHYIESGWQIPTYKKTHPITGEEIEYYDHKKMRATAFPFIGFQLYIAKKYLQENLPPKQSKKPKKAEVLSEQITHPKRNEIAKAIKDKYDSYKGKKFKILYEALVRLDLFPKKGKRSVFFRCLQNEGYEINNSQMLEDKYFERGFEKLNGDYLQSEDEKERDKIIKYLKTIIET